LPVRVLSRVFRGKFVAGLRAARGRGEGAGGGGGGGFASWLQGPYEHEGGGDAPPPAAGPGGGVEDLARDRSPGAVCEARLVDVRDGRVTFRAKDYAAGGRPRPVTLSVLEFLRRWTEHVLPRGFVAARHYGLLANRGRQEQLALCRQLLWPGVYVAVGV